MAMSDEEKKSFAQKFKTHADMSFGAGCVVSEQSHPDLNNGQKYVKLQTADKKFLSLSPADFDALVRAGSTFIKETGMNVTRSEDGKVRKY